MSPLTPTGVVADACKKFFNDAADVLDAGWNKFKGALTSIFKPRSWQVRKGRGAFFYSLGVCVGF